MKTIFPSLRGMIIPLCVKDLIFEEEKKKNNRIFVHILMFTLLKRIMSTRFRYKRPRGLKILLRQCLSLHRLRRVAEPKLESFRTTRLRFMRVYI